MDYSGSVLRFDQARNDFLVGPPSGQGDSTLVLVVRFPPLASGETDATGVIFQQYDPGDASEGWKMVREVDGSGKANLLLYLSTAPTSLSVPLTDALPRRNKPYVITMRLGTGSHFLQVDGQSPVSHTGSNSTSRPTFYGSDHNGANGVSMDLIDVIHYPATNGLLTVPELSELLNYFDYKMNLSGYTN